MPILGPILGPILIGSANGGVGSSDVLPPITIVKTATFGDSTANGKNYAITANALDQSVGDRETTGAVISTNMSDSKWQLSRYYAAAAYEFNAGISGQTTQQMLDRSGQAAGPTRRSMEDVVTALGLDTNNLVIFRGGVNDISGFTAATPQATIDAVATRIMQIVNGLRAGGNYVLVEGIAGYDASGGVAPPAPDLAAIRAALVSINTQVSAGVQALGLRRVRFLSPIGVTCDATGAFLANITAASDGTHLTNFGQRQIALAEAAQMPGWIGPSNPTAYPGTNLIAAEAAYPSPVSVAFGTVPNTTQFSWLANAGTRQNAVIETINGAPYAVCELLGTGASARVDFQANLKPLIIDTADVVANDVVTIEADVIAEALNGGAFDVRGIEGRLQLGVSGTDRIVYDLMTELSPSTGTETSFTGKIGWGKIKIPSSIASLTSANTFAFVRCNCQNGQTVRLKVGNWRIVKQ